MNCVALVTGGSRGIGKEIVISMLENNYKVVFCSRNSSELLEAERDIQDKLSSKHRKNVLAIKCDVSEYTDVSAMVSRTVDSFGSVDILVNNAAVSKINNGKRFSIAEVSIEQWSTTLQINLTGAFNLCKAVTPYMIKQKRGHIINISSALERTGRGLGSVDYIASKSGLVGLSKALAYELGKYNIRVNVVSPGRTVTKMLDGVSASENKKWAEENIPLQRLGIPKDIADIVLFLAKNVNCYINGANIDCNGGAIY